MKQREKIRDADLEITHVRGSGPGGQNRNKRWTGVRMVHLPTGIVVNATERRSQGQNLAAAYERMAERLEAHYFRPKLRIDTKVSRAEKAKRTQSKRHRSNVKQQRSKKNYDD